MTARQVATFATKAAAALYTSRSHTKQNAGGRSAAALAKARAAAGDTEHTLQVLDSIVAVTDDVAVIVLSGDDGPNVWLLMDVLTRVNIIIDVFKK